jgi:phosphoglucomutase
MGEDIFTSLIEDKKGHAVNTVHSYHFEGADGMLKIREIMKMFRFCFEKIGGLRVEKMLDYSRDQDGLPKADVIEYLLEGGSAVVIRPSGNEPKLNVYISATDDSKESAAKIEARVRADVENIIYIDERMGYCCE